MLDLGPAISAAIMVLLLGVIYYIAASLRGNISGEQVRHAPPSLWDMKSWETLKEVMHQDELSAYKLHTDQEYTRGEALSIVTGMFFLISVFGVASYIILWGILRGWIHL